METLKDLSDFCKYGNKNAMIKHGKLIGFSSKFRDDKLNKLLANKHELVNACNFAGADYLIEFVDY